MVAVTGAIVKLLSTYRHIPPTLVHSLAYIIWFGGRFDATNEVCIPSRLLTRSRPPTIDPIHSTYACALGMLVHRMGCDRSTLVAPSRGAVIVETNEPGLKALSVDRHTSPT